MGLTLPAADFLGELGLDEPAAGLAVGGVLLALVLWLGWRMPTLVLMIALASLALRPELLWGGPAVGYAWGLHHTLIVFGLVMNAVRYGIRIHGGWPILALIVTFALSLAFGDVHRKLTLPFMLMSFGLLALPFTFTQVALAPGSRRAYAMVIMMTPLLSVALGGLLQLSGTYEMFNLNKWTGDWYRLDGATGNAGVFATLALGGFAVALHEATRPGRPYAGPFAAINLALVILSGSRMGIFASGVFLVAYVALSEDLRALLRQHRTRAIIGVSLVVATLVVYWPTLEGRLFAGDTLRFSPGRAELWSFYWQEFLFSPVFGRGFGAGLLAAADAYPDLPLSTVHNEYLRLLVSGGVLGFVLIAGAIVMWYRHWFRVASPNDGCFMLALAPALLAYAVTDNVLFYSSALPLYAYLGMLLTWPAFVATGWPVEPASRDAGHAAFHDAESHRTAWWQQPHSPRAE